MRHNTFLCDPHVPGCECGPDQETRDQMVCNPYYVFDYCPAAGEGEECEADPNRLVRVPCGGGFTLGIRED